MGRKHAVGELALQREALSVGGGSLWLVYRWTNMAILDYKVHLIVPVSSSPLVPPAFDQPPLPLPLTPLPAPRAHDASSILDGKRYCELNVLQAVLKHGVQS